MEIVVMSSDTLIIHPQFALVKGCKEIQPVHPKGNQSWIFMRRIDVEAATPILWPPDAKNWFIRKDPDAGKDWRQEQKGMTEDEMVGWHHRLDRVWASSGSWWWTGKPGVLQSMGLQRIGHNWATKLNCKVEYMTIKIVLSEMCPSKMLIPKDKSIPWRKIKNNSEDKTLLTPFCF